MGTHINLRLNVARSRTVIVIVAATILLAACSSDSDDPPVLDPNDIDPKTTIEE